MRFKNLDLNLLVALDTMLELKSISLSANRMHITQSAMSNALTRLREHCGDPLLVRVGQKMELTERAEAMRSAVRDILVRVDAAVLNAPVFDPKNTTREFRILLSDYTMTLLAPRLIQVLAEQGARARLQFLPQTQKPYIALEQGETDVLITPSIFCSPSHPAQLLYDDTYVAVVCSASRLAKDTLTIDDYKNAEHVQMQSRPNHRAFETQFLEDLDIVLNIAIKAFSFSDLPSLLIGTERVATMHRRLAQHCAQHYPITLKELPFPTPRLEQMVQWHGYRSSDIGLKWLLDQLQIAAKLM